MNTFLKLIPSILMTVFGVLQLLIDIFWSDGRTKKHRRIKKFLLPIFIIASILSACLIYNETQESEDLTETIVELKNNSDLQISEIKNNHKEAITIVKRSDSLSRVDNQELKEMLTPFIDLATKRYPKKNTGDALNKLIGEINSVREIATSDVYKPYSRKKKKEIIAKLKKVKSKHTVNPKIIFIISKSSKNNEIVITELIELLVESGFTVQKQYAFLPRTFPKNPWEIHLIKNNVYFIDDIFWELKSFINPNPAVTFRDDEQWVKRQGKFPSDEIQICIFENPKFKNNGQVSY